jgi:uncharacterized membrane protein
MSNERGYLPVSLASIPASADLVVLVGATALADLSLVTAPSTPVRLLPALPLFLLFPGYAVVSALFPKRRVGVAGRRTGIDGVERLGLSFGVSLALLPVVGVVLLAAQTAVTTATVAAAHSTVVVLGAVVAAVRRAALPTADRFETPATGVVDAVRSNLLDAPRRDVVANVAVLVAVLAATSVVAAGVVAPLPRGGYDTVSVLTEADDGSLVAADYPDSVATDESTTLVVSVENHRRAATDYTVVVQLQGVEEGAVVRRAELDRFAVGIGAGETATRRHSVRPSFAGDDLRLTYLLYRGDPPDEPTRANAAREVHLWIDVPE